MAPDRKLPRSLAAHYAVPALILVAAVPLGQVAGAAPMAGLLLLGCLSLASTASLLSQMAKAREEQRSLDEQLVQSQKLAAIGELSSGIAHEINNPLAIIAQEAEWMRHLMERDDVRGLQGLADIRDSMAEIGRQVERCKEVTHRLLNFARKMETLIQKVDVNRLIEDMTRLVEREATQKNIRILRQYQKDLPVVCTDSPLLRQVVLNLLNNAAYAIGQDGTITITTRMAAKERVEILVSDTGCGIPKENLGRIFNPFFTTKPPGKGTGLGLAISHRIIDRLGGHLTVTSEVGKGTEFAIRLPLEQ